MAANLDEAWRKRRYQAAFISKINDAEAEAAETQTWIEFANAFGFISEGVADELMEEYEALIGTLVGIVKNADKWTLQNR